MYKFILAAFLVISPKVYACVDYTGQYYSGNMRIQFAQTACDSVDYMLITAGEAPIPSPMHVDMGKVNSEQTGLSSNYVTREFGWAWKNNNLAYSERYLDKAGNPSFTRVMIFSIDSGSNLRVTQTFWSDPNSPTTLPETIFKKL